MSQVNCCYKGWHFLPLHRTCTLYCLLFRFATPFFSHVCLINGNSRFKIHSFCLQGEIIKNEAKKKVILNPCYHLELSQVSMYFCLLGKLATFLQYEICVFAMIFLDTYFSNASLKCHYFAEATTALLNGSIKINLRCPEAFSGKSQQ